MAASAAPWADDFVPALDQILSRTPKVDHIIIETSGLALPKPLVQAFQWPTVKSRVTVDGVITVVDGAALADGKVASDLDALAKQRAADETLDHDDPVEEVFDDQVACADLIILSKSDLIDAAGAARANAALGDHVRPGVRVVPSANGKVDASLLLGLGLAVEDDIENRKTHHDGAFDHEHDDFDSFVVEIPAVANPDELAKRVADAAEKENVLRVKGFVEVSAKPMRLLVQAVGPRVNHYYDRAWTAGDDRRSRLVVIGLKGLNQQAIEKILVG
jgi:cobalamin biosynthesis protein CobW